MGNELRRCHLFARFFWCWLHSGFITEGLELQPTLWAGFKTGDIADQFSSEGVWLSEQMFKAIRP